MLKKLIKFDNIGLLRDGIPVPAEFDVVTLVYAENGRGKSTLANVLRALGGLDAQSVIDGQTIDSDDAPHVHTICEVNGTSGPVRVRFAYPGYVTPLSAPYNKKILNACVTAGVPCAT